MEEPPFGVDFISTFPGTVEMKSKKKVKTVFSKNKVNTFSPGQGHGPGPMDQGRTRAQAGAHGPGPDPGPMGQAHGPGPGPMDQAIISEAANAADFPPHMKKVKPFLRLHEH